MLEIQKLAYFLERSIEKLELENPLGLRFQADKYGPYAPRLTHLLNGLDGNYLHCGKRIGDAGPFDVIWFEDAKRDKIAAYLGSGDAKAFLPALEATAKLIDGFESPLGMELLATIDWLIQNDGVAADRESIKTALKTWTGGETSAARKLKLFEDNKMTRAIACKNKTGGSTAASTRHAVLVSTIAPTGIEPGSDSKSRRNRPHIISRGRGRVLSGVPHPLGPTMPSETLTSCWTTSGGDSVALGARPTPKALIARR